MYLYDTWAVFKVKERRTPLMWSGIFFNVAILVIATVVMGGGTYGSVCVSPSSCARASSPRSLVPLSSRLPRSPHVLIRLLARRLNIRDDYSTNGGRPWSCADNSGSS